MMSLKLFIYLVFFFISSNECELRSGPDPWHYNYNEFTDIKQESDIPPDLREPLKKHTRIENNDVVGEWFFRRSLAIILKGGQLKKNDDGSTDVALQMRFSPKQWNTLEDYLKSEIPFSEDMLRRSLGYVEDAIYKPTVIDQIVMAWKDYIQIYLIEYKTLIIWTLGISAGGCTLIWLWSRMSHKQLLFFIFMILYLYEVLISYKEAEQQELDSFVTAMNKCKWYFWSKTCDVPSPDPLVFMKHMNPMKIGIRMFSSLISEPMVVMSSTIDKMLRGITDGMWFPIDKIVYSILVVLINIYLIFFLISIISNLIFNTSFQLSMFGLSVSLLQRSRTIFTSNPTDKEQTPKPEVHDRISESTFNKLLDVCSQALNMQQNNKAKVSRTIQAPTIRRSASTGRLPNSTFLKIKNDPWSQAGGGDAH